MQQLSLQCNSQHREGTLYGAATHTHTHTHRGEIEVRQQQSDTGEEEGRISKLLVLYRNVNGLLSSMMEVRGYLRESKPDVLCIAETKLKRRNPDEL